MQTRARKHSLDKADPERVRYFRLPQKDDKRLQKIADAEEISVALVLRRLVRAFLSKGGAA